MDSLVGKLQQESMRNFKSSDGQIISDELRNYCNSNSFTNYKIPEYLFLSDDNKKAVIFVSKNLEEGRKLWVTLSIPFYYRNGWQINYENKNTIVFSSPHIDIPVDTNFQNWYFEVSKLYVMSGYYEDCNGEKSQTFFERIWNWDVPSLPSDSSRISADLLPLLVNTDL
jgi:hypothetical protein